MMSRVESLHGRRQHLWVETGNNWRKPMKSKHVFCPLIPIRALESSLDDSSGNMEEIGDKYERSGK